MQDRDHWPPEHTPEQILDAASIQNVDTARMALRWALERLQKLERDKTDLADKARDEERLRLKAEEERAAVQRTLSLRSGENDQRELYYAKLEEFLTLQLQGRLDPAAVAKRELEAAQLQELMQRKEQQLEKERQAQKVSLDRDFERLREETERQAKAEVQRAERAAEAKREALEQEHLLKLADIHERQAALKQAERGLAERQAHFEQYYAQQRAQLQSELRNFRAEIDDQVQFRTQVAERLIEERSAALQQGWAREKALLVRELEGWRARAHELGPKALELERALALADDAALKARAQADRQTMLLEELRQSSAAERQALAAETERWRAQALAVGEEARGNRESLAAAEERARRAAASAEAQAASFEESGKAWERERDSLAAEKQEWRSRTEELLERNLELGKRLAVAEESAVQTKAAAERQIEVLELRVKSGAQELESASAELAEARERGARADRLARRVDELSAERDALRAELDEARAKAREVLPRLSELERGLTAAEESEGAVERHLARLRERESAWGRERAELSSELTSTRKDLEAAIARGLAAERDLAAAREAAEQLRGLGERQAARFDERLEAWQAERAELLARLVDAEKPKKTEDPGIA